MSTTLLLVAAMGVGFAADCFPIWNFRRLKHHFRVVSLLQLGDDYFDVLLSGAGDEKFFGLSVAEEAHHLVLFHELVKTVGELVLIRARLRFDCECDRRLGKRHLWKVHGPRLVAEAVTGQSAFEFGYGSDVTRVEFRHAYGVLALHYGNMRQFLSDIAGKIVHRSIIPQYPGKHFEE